MGAVAAFFDLDKTLIGANSAWEWSKHERTLRNITRWQQVRVAVWLGLYHASVVNIEQALTVAVRHYRGTPERSLDQRTSDWFQANLASRLRSDARAALAEHAASSHPRILLTTSSSFVAAEATRSWGLDAWLANSFPTDSEGRLTGDIGKPVCYGAGKVAHAERWAAENDVDLDRSYFYTDSYSDLPMLERVAEPRVVTPDPRLRRAAIRRGWPILEWT